MDNNKHNADLIERHLSGELLPEELKSFNEKLKSDPEFSDLYDFMVKIKDVWRSAAEYSKVRSMVSGIGQKRKSAKRYSMRFMYHAATVALLVGIYFVVENRGERYDIDDKINDPLVAVRELKKLEKRDNKFVYHSGKLKEGQKLISPIDNSVLVSNKEITFIWNTETDSLSSILIFKNGKELKKYKVRLSDKKFTVLPNTFTCGTYSWTINGVEGKGTFSIK